MLLSKSALHKKVATIRTKSVDRLVLQRFYKYNKYIVIILKPELYIMYNHQLETFIKVVESGSFIKASQNLYISPNAVTKQINALERRLNLKLLDRSNKGVIPTKAGKIIYEEAIQIIKRSESILKKAHESENSQNSVIRIGVSLMHPFELFIDKYQEIFNFDESLKLQVVPFEDDIKVVRKNLEHFDDYYDIVPAIHDADIFMEYCNGFHLCGMPVKIGVPESHPLSQKEHISNDDLRGKTLLMPKIHLNSITGDISNYISKYCSETNLISVEYYEFSVFNKAVRDSELVISSDCWSKVHPTMVTLPCDLPFSFNYGFIYSKNPTPAASALVEKLQTAMENKQ